MKINTYVLSTVDLDQSLIAHALEHGVEIDAVSFIQVDPVKDDNLREELEEMSKLQLTAVFTSANAINAISETLQSCKPNWNVYCIGNATKKAVLQYFDASCIKGTANDGAALADIIEANGILEVVFFCGDKRLDALPDFLYQHEITVHEIVVYKTKETPVAVKKHYQGVMFFSPNGVNSFFSVNNVAPQTTLFAIGHTTEGAVRTKADKNTIVVSDTPSKEEMVQKVIEYFHKQHAGGSGTVN